MSEDARLGGGRAGRGNSVLAVAALTVAIATGLSFWPGAEDPPAAGSLDVARTPCATGVASERRDPRPTTIDTIEQAYRCILTSYYDGVALDHQELLLAAFRGFVDELRRQGLDRPEAALPAFTGDDAQDWERFATAYGDATQSLDVEPEALQALAAATMTAMVASLDDNHARWTPAQPTEAGTRGQMYGIGLTVSGIHGGAADPAAVPPLFVVDVADGSPAAAAGVLPGDVIEAVDGTAAFIAGRLSPAVVETIAGGTPSADPIDLTVRRPVNGATWTVTLAPGSFAAPTAEVVARSLGDGTGYVAFTEFFPGVADRVLAEIAALSAGEDLDAVVFDLRGNHGGAPAEVARMLGAFVHGATSSSHCDADGTCTPVVTDDSVPLIDLELVVLTDRACASACEDFSAAVKGLQLGTLIGDRTAGAVAGPAAAYFLDDGSELRLPERHHRGPNSEVVDLVGVVPDYVIPTRADDLSSGNDPALLQALAILTRLERAQWFSSS